MFWFIVLLLLAGAGFYFYQKLMTIEREIRAEQEAEAARAAAARAQQDTKVAGEEKPGSVEVKEEPSAAEPVREARVVEPAVAGEDVAGLETRIVAAVTEQPGVKQTELYGKFTEISKKQLQALLKEMADSGALKREKKGSSYLLFPA